jgi:autotransporter strand-loop-strand O-heptosyltransferase
MRIVQINPGHMEIPPKNWGAVEKIIWYYSLELKKLGHEVDIKYLNEINPGEYDIVHVHMWNQALHLYEMGIPYVYTFHDHNAYLQGNNTSLYLNNLLAMKLADISIVPAKFLIDYFEDIPIYLEHGISLDEYYPGGNKNGKLLCVGNNGVSANPTFDRKGFRYAIRAAEKLNLDITIVGPTDSNLNFFNKNKNLLLPNVNVIYDATSDELKEIYRNHSMLIHATSIEAGHPPLTILEAAASGLPVITTDCSGDLYTLNVDRDYNEISEKINHVLSNYDSEQQKTLESVQKYDWKNVVLKLENLYKGVSKTDMRNKSLNMYKSIKKINHRNLIKITFNDGAKVNISGQKPEKYEIKFIDANKNELVYSSSVSTNSWAKTNKKYYSNWKVIVTDSKNNVIEHDFDLKDKKVLILLDSKSLGDTIAWIPYVDEFRKKHGCKTYVTAFNSYLFESMYPELNFVHTFDEIPDCYATYKIGWYYDENEYDRKMNPTDPNKMPLQQTITDILGLEYEEIKPRIIELPKYEAERPYVCIATHSTAQAKYWNNSTGWQELVDYFNSIGIDVYLISSEEDGYMGNKQPIGVKKINKKSLDEIGSILLGSKMFIGLGSGLTWYAWALNVPTILISGFSKPWQEMKSDIIRVINTDVCHGCFAKHLFNRGDWDWCPEHKGTSRQFECTKSITFDMVKPHIENLLKI